MSYLPCITFHFRPQKNTNFNWANLDPTLSQQSTLKNHNNTNNYTTLPLYSNFTSILSGFVFIYPLISTHFSNFPSNIEILSLLFTHHFQSSLVTSLTFPQPSLKNVQVNHRIYFVLIKYGSFVIRDIMKSGIMVNRWMEKGQGRMEERQSTHPTKTGLLREQTNRYGPRGQDYPVKVFTSSPYPDNPSENLISLFGEKESVDEPKPFPFLPLPPHGMSAQENSPITLSCRRRSVIVVGRRRLAFLIQFPASED